MGLIFAPEMERKKGTGSFPSFFPVFFPMSQPTPLEQVSEMLTPLLEADEFLVDLRIKPTNNFKLYLDADSGMAIEKCIRINRALYRKIEEAGLFPEGDFSLEVSSPGLDEPLKLHRQYLKNKGRKVEVALIDGSRKEGLLKEVGDLAIMLEYTEGKGKKAVTLEAEIPFSEIRQTKVSIPF